MVGAAEELCLLRVTTLAGREPDVARLAGVATATAGPGTIRDELVLYGAIAPDATRVRDVRARFPGVIRSVARNVGDRVRSGETLATIESTLETANIAFNSAAIEDTAALVRFPDGSEGIYFGSRVTRR